MSSPGAAEPAPVETNDFDALVPSDDDLAIRTWGTSEEHENFRRRRSQLVGTALGGMLIAIGGTELFAGLVKVSSVTSGVEQLRTLAVILVVVSVVVLGYCAVPYLSLRLAFRRRALAVASAQVDYAIKQATVGSDDATLMRLPQLFALNRRQLDQYQVLTRRQQRSAFRNAQVMGLIGFLVLVAGIVLALTAAQGDAEKYVSGGLGAVGSALSGYLAATFYAASKDANTQMNRYYLKPQRTGRLLAVEKIVRDMDPKGAAQISIIEAVLNREMPVEGRPSSPAAGTPATGTGP